jgi:hypothetical protein
VGSVGRTFPPRTILLPKNTITIPYQKIANTASVEVALYDAQNELVTATWMKKTSPIKSVVADKTESSESEIETIVQEPSIVGSGSDDKFIFLSDKETLPMATSTDLNQAAIQNQPQIIDIKAATPDQVVGLTGQGNLQSKATYIALIGILLLAFIGVVFSKK